MRTHASLHLWWARRPVTLCRAVIATSLLPTMKHKFEKKAMISQVLRGCTLKAGYEEDNKDLEVLRSLIREHLANQPVQLLDPFAGGGSIPLEGLRLGLNVHARDLNPVSFLIRECALSLIPQYRIQPKEAKETLKGSLEEQVKYWANKIEIAIKNRLNNPSKPALDVYGQEGVISWLWVKTTHCTSCKAEIPLLSLTKLRTKTDPVNIGIKVDPSRAAFNLFPSKSDRIRPFLDRKRLFCPFCEEKTTSLSDIKRLASHDRLGLGITPIAKILPVRPGKRRIFA
ncbi:MAG: DUF1156 domain-containing protein, partial [Candidatus Hodarchaeota archaeon]